MFLKKLCQMQQIEEDFSITLDCLFRSSDFNKSIEKLRDFFTGYDSGSVIQGADRTIAGKGNKRYYIAMKDSKDPFVRAVHCTKTFNFMLCECGAPH